MRKLYAIATFIIVAGFSLIGMSQRVLASVLYLQTDDSQTNTQGVSGYSFDYTFSNVSDVYFTVSTPDNLGTIYVDCGLIFSMPASSLTVGVKTLVHLTVGSGTCNTRSDRKIYIYKSLGSALTVYGASGFYPYLVLTDSGGGFSPDVTSFLSFTPSDGSIISTTTATTTAFSFYLSGNDYVGGSTYNYSLTRQVTGLGDVGNLPVFGGTGGATRTIYSGSQGVVPSYNYFSTTTPLLITGTYNFQVDVRKANFIIGIRVFDTILISTTTTFYVGSSTSLSTVLGSTIVGIGNALASTTSSIGNVCNVLSLSFSFSDCVVGFFIPSSGTWNEDIVILRGTPPWGYAFRMYDIFSSTASSSLPTLSVSVPSILPGGGSSMILSFDHILDPLLNATSGPFITSTATSSRTFYEITSFYWDIIVYIGLLLYILMRLLGSHLFPLVGGFSSHGSLGDNSSSDDSYRLKEYLYNHRKK